MPTSVQALIVIAFAITPGYMCLWVARSVIKQASKRSDVELVISTIAFGLLINGITFKLGGQGVLERYRDGTVLDSPGALLGWAVLTSILVPVILGTIFGVVINTWPEFFARFGLGWRAEPLHAWDYALQGRESVYVRVWLDDGRVIGGLFGDESFASSDRVHRDLYLEEVWSLDSENYFTDPVPNSVGIWVSHEYIRRLEFIAPEIPGGTYVVES